MVTFNFITSESNKRSGEGLVLIISTHALTHGPHQHMLSCDCRGRSHTHPLPVHTNRRGNPVHRRMRTTGADLRHTGGCG